VRQLYKANFLGGDEEWRRVGFNVGSIAKRLVDFNTPNVDFVYERPIMTDLAEREIVTSERNGEPKASDL